MHFNFPGTAPTATEAPSTTKHVYLVENNDPHNARIECDYIQFTPTHVTFWEDHEPWDRLIVAIPLTAGGYVRKAEGDDES